MVAVASHIAAQALGQNQHILQIHANNISNQQSIAYNAMSPRCVDSFYSNLDRANSRIGQQGHGSQIAAVRSDPSVGSLDETKRALDVAIVAPSYYMAVQLPNNKIGYTRIGSLRRTAAGEIVLDNGQDLSFENLLAIDPNVPLEEIEISDSGFITYTNPENRMEKIDVGQLTLFTFVNPDGLYLNGSGIYEATEESGPRVEVQNSSDKFRQGYLEKSNVNAISELLEITERTQQASVLSKILEADNKIQQAVVDSAKL